MREGTRQALLRALAALSLAAGVLVVGAPAASAAPLCALDSGSKTLTVAPQDATGIKFKAASPYLSVNDVSCALLNDTNTVIADMTAFPNAQVQFDLTGGPLGPGYVIESDGTSEIEFQVQNWANGTNAFSNLDVRGTTGDDKVTFGQFFNRLNGTLVGQVNLNAGIEATPDVDVSFPSFPMTATVATGAGHDVVSGGGLGTINSSAYSGTLRLFDDGTGNDQMTGGAGNDEIYPTLNATDADVWSGGAGTDTLSIQSQVGDEAAISLDGIANDGLGCPLTCQGANASADFENVLGGNANETITGNGANNTLRGGFGSNILNGGGGADMLLASYNGNTFWPERYRGGLGRDTVNFSQYQAPYGVNVTMDGLPNDGFATQGSNVGKDVEVVIGSQGNDFLAGSDGGETLNGISGSDDLRGLGGNDTLIPGGGPQDFASGGPGVDELSFDIAGVPITFDVPTKTVTGYGTVTFASMEAFRGGSAADTFIGSTGGETFRGGDGADTIAGGDGDDSLYGNKGDDGIDGGAGTDTCVQGPGSGTVVNCEA
jgi:Ca2+-binding RTX toxin-like protein